MDPTTAVRMDTMPGIATFIAPGGFASAPYAWVVLSNSDKLGAFLDRHEAIALASAILLWIVAGLVIESIGSYVEVYAIDRRQRDHGKMTDAWWRYLRIAWKVEPVGQRYLRRFLVSFKFELNMCVASVLAAPGMVWLGTSGTLSGSTSAVAVVALLHVAGGFFWLACESSGVLAELRNQLLRGVGEPPFDEDGNPRVRVP